MDSYFVIISKIDDINKYYYVNISENKFEYHILVGGLKIKCVSIIINKKNNNALLELYQHHIKCSLEKGEEVIDLLKNTLYFISQKFPTIKYIEFIDNSFIQCKNKKKISLPDLSFAKYNKTWYEKNFNAIPSKSSKDNIKMLKRQIIKNLSKKIKLSTHEFQDEFYSNELFQKKKILEIIKDAYIKDNTLKEYLDKLKEYDCVFYEKIFNKKIGTLLQGTEWIIKIDSIKNSTINSIIKNIEKIKENNDLNKLFKKLVTLNNNESKKNGGNIYDGGLI